MSTSQDSNLFLCACEPWMRSACIREAFYKEHNGQTYCVLHYPNRDKAGRFEEAFARKVQSEDFDFRGVWFPREVDFSQKTISDANFRGAVFNANANFRGALFLTGASFNESRFSEYADFTGAQFDDVDFSKAKFICAEFGNTCFKEANFIDAEFKEDSHFTNARFLGDAKFNPSSFFGRVSFSNARFRKAFFGDTDFLGGAYFGNAQFAGPVDFGQVKFGSPIFENARFFADARFIGANFSGSPVFVGTQFAKANFNYAVFEGNANFSLAKFEGEADFSNAQMRASAFFSNTEFEKNAYFIATRFMDDPAPAQLKAPQGVHGGLFSFDGAKFQDAVVFENSNFDPKATVRFFGATFEHGDRVSFQNITLRPVWFVNVNARPLNFIKIHWNKLYRRDLIPFEIASLKRDCDSAYYESLEIVCRQLAINAEENNRFEEAARFRFVANSVRARGSWHNLIAKPSEWESWTNLNPWLWGYGFVSGYSERIWQAALVLIGIWIVFAAIFFIGQSNGEWWRASPTSATHAGVKPALEKPALEDFGEALIYSAGVLTLQKPEPLPANKRATTFVLLETLLGPLQIALLALAIRRKFMR